MHITQRKFWYCQLTMLLWASAIALFIWQWILSRFFPAIELFYLPRLFCGVNCCAADNYILPFMGQYFLLSIFCFYLLMIMIIERISLKWKAILHQMSYAPWLVGIVAIILLSASWEGVARARSFLKDDLPLLSVPYTLQYEREYPAAYYYAQNAKALLSKKYLQAEVDTDIDFSSLAGRYDHRALSYFLYPINIRVDYPGRKPNVLLLFGKNNALKHVPAGYKILSVINQKNIIAVKE